jgi:single-stranded DNA-binding protein
MNIVILTGYVGASPVIKAKDETKPDERYAEFSLATKRYRRDGETTDWHSIKAFDKRIVAVIDKFVGKGTHISVIGHVEYYVPPSDTKKQKFTNIVINQLELVGRANSDQADESIPLPAGGAADLTKDPLAPQ